MGCSIVLLQCRIHTPSKPRTGPFRKRIGACVRPVSLAGFLS